MIAVQCLPVGTCQYSPILDENFVIKYTMHSLRIPVCHFLKNLLYIMYIHYANSLSLAKLLYIITKFSFTVHCCTLHTRFIISPFPPFISYLIRFSIQENHTKSLTFSYQLSTHLHGVYTHFKPFQNMTSRILHTIDSQFPYISS